MLSYSFSNKTKLINLIFKAFICKKLKDIWIKKNI